MALTEQYLEEDIHPIDIVENLAAYHDWDFVLMRATHPDLFHHPRVVAL